MMLFEDSKLIGELEREGARLGNFYNATAKSRGELMKKAARRIKELAK